MARRVHLVHHLRDIGETPTAVATSVVQDRQVVSVFFGSQLLANEEVTVLEKSLCMVDPRVGRVRPHHRVTIEPIYGWVH